MPPRACREGEGPPNRSLAAPRSRDACSGRYKPGRPEAQGIFAEPSLVPPADPCPVQTTACLISIMQSYKTAISGSFGTEQNRAEPSRTEQNREGSRRTEKERGEPTHPDRPNLDPPTHDLLRLAQCLPQPYQLISLQILAPDPLPCDPQRQATHGSLDIQCLAARW
jgi:hypothetical protein